MIITKEQMFEELGDCAIEQGYSFNIGKKIYLDLSIVIRLKEIIDCEFK